MGIPKIREENKVIVTDELSSRLVTSLATGEISAIIVPGYYPKRLCKKAADKFINHPDYGSYHSAGHSDDVSTVKRVGISYFEACNDINMIKKYHDEAASMTAEFRELFAPYYSPIDKLRLDLQEIWPVGANLESLGGKKMFVGLCRAVEPGKEFLPHQDVLHRDAPNSIEAWSLKGQIACNIYLNMAETGGELELWDKDYDKQGYEKIRLAGSYGMDRKRMPPSVALIKPEVGDLVLFNSQRPHAVHASEECYRMSVSCFIGYRGEHMPLSYWS